MGEQGCPVCAAMSAPEASGLVLVQTDLIDARHAALSDADPANDAGCIELRPRRHVARWERLNPAERAELERLTIALSLALHRVTGARAVRPDDSGQDAGATGHVCRRLQPEYETPPPAWLTDPRWRDAAARAQTSQELVERLRADLQTAS